MKYESLDKWESYLPSFVIRNVTPIQKKRYERFLKVLELLEAGASRRRISREMDIERKLIYDWLNRGEVPVVANLYNLLSEFKTEIPPQKMLVPFGHPPSSHTFVNKVWVFPRNVRSFDDVKEILEQLLQRTPSEEDLNDFGFLLGYYLSDGSYSNHTGEGRTRAHNFFAVTSNTAGNMELLIHVQSILAKLGFSCKIAVSCRNELLLYTNFSFFFDYLRYVIIGTPDGVQKTYHTPENLGWILETPKPFQNHVLKGLVEGDGGAKTAINILGISVAPMFDFAETLCNNLGLKTWHDDDKIYIRFNYKNLEQLIGLVFLDGITTDKKQELKNWCEKLVKNSLATAKNGRKLLPSALKKIILDYSKMRGHKDRVSYYEIAKNNGYHLVTVLNILKGRTRRKDTEKLCERFKLQLPWQ